MTAIIQYYNGTPRCEDQMWRVECESVLHYCGGRGLDPGAGQRTLSADIVRVDQDIACAPHHVADAMHLPFQDGAFDFVFGCHTLEHCIDPRGALVEQLRVVRVGGCVCHVIPDTIFTLGQNTDATPHRYEWSPREFLEDVLGFRDRSVDWFKARFDLSWASGRVVDYGPSCPRWSFKCVVEKLPR